MKEMILGLAAGMVAGAVLVRSCKPCAQLADDVTAMVESKMKSSKGGQAKSAECECGSDCGCTGNRSQNGGQNSQQLCGCNN